MNCYSLINIELINFYLQYDDPADRALYEYVHD